jgi:hypothetical protein
MSDINDENPTVGSRFETEQEAELILRSLLPSRWLWRKQSPDFFVDYDIETIDCGELTGFHFALQIKGTSKSSSEKVRLRMQRKHLKYYRDKARLPVFIGFVDVVRKQVYWVFAQKYLREQLGRSDVDDQKSLTLKVDTEDSFSDLDRFKDALRKAELYMRELYPGSPKAAVAARKEELQSLDPDIDVDVSFERGEKLTFTSRKPISLQLTGRGADQWKAYLAMLDHGDDFQAEVEVVPPESPLFQKLMPPGKRLIKFTPQRFKGCVQIICGTSPQTIIQVPGEWRGGRKSVKFQGILEKSPLSVELQLSDFLEKASPEMSFNTPLRLSAWEGELISCLPWLEEIRSFLTALAAGEQFVLNYFINGMKLGGCEAVANPSQDTFRLKEEIDWLSRAQAVAVHYGSLAKLPSLVDISARTETDVEALWGLITGSVIEQSIAGIRFTIRTDPTVALPTNSEQTDKPISGDMKMVGTATFDFFGQLIEVPDTEQVFTRMELVDCESDSKSRHLTFEGKEKATLTRRKVA